MKVAIYTRVSLDERDKDSRQFQDPGNQLQPLREFCKSFGWEIYQEYVDRMSGANPARPDFRRMMSDAMQRKFSGIIVWKLDRFSREGIVPTMAYIQKLKSRGIWLKSMTESWLDTGQEGITEIVLAIMAWASSEERKKISEEREQAPIWSPWFGNDIALASSGGKRREINDFQNFRTLFLQPGKNF